MRLSIALRNAFQINDHEENRVFFTTRGYMAVRIIR